jgi:hypothetical protein
MSEHSVLPFEPEHGDRTRVPQHVGGAALGSDQVDTRTQHRGAMGRQDFSHTHNADSSRNHFGNVYNNIYPSIAQPEVAKVGLDLMEALKFDSMGDRIMSVSPACAQTCTWFLDRPEYTSWRASADREKHNGVLWIKGKAGAGKSTLMRFIYDHAQKQYQDELHLPFFFNGRSPDQLAKSVEGMYRSVLYQLYTELPRLKAAAARRVTIAKEQIWSIEIFEEYVP